MINKQQNKLLQLFRRFTDHETYVTLIQEVSKQKQEDPVCPHCESICVVRYGKYRDRQRYKCKSCSRTFNDLTNTPLHRTRYPQKWIKFLECMIKGYSLHRCSVIVGVNYVTLFYWRHKIIQALLKKQTTPIVNLPANPQYICVRLYTPVIFLFSDERRPFQAWMKDFDWIASKYYNRYLAWFRYTQQIKNEEMLEAIQLFLLRCCSIRFEQTYTNLREAA